jgi:hypothetical protein
MGHSKQKKEYSDLESEKLSQLSRAAWRKEGGKPAGRRQGQGCGPQAGRCGGCLSAWLWEEWWGDAARCGGGLWTEGL